MFKDKNKFDSKYNNISNSKDPKETKYIDQIPW